MPNKKKGKGKDKGKDEKAINLVRFAYDIFRFSALKFNVPSQSIAVWEGPENDYECSDFILVVSRLVLVHQINMRNQLNPILKRHFEPRMRNSLEHIREIFRKVIEMITADHTLGIIANVELSLATVCELILFLYSENSNLFLVQLAELWFRCYLKPNRVKFKRKGGLDEIYKKGQEKRKDIPDALIDAFIVAFCTNYQNSAQVDLEEMYFNTVRNYKQKNFEKYYTEESDDPDIDIPHSTYLVVKIPLTSVKDEDTGVNLPPNPLLGVTPPSEMYDFPLGGDAPLSENLPEKSVQELSKRTKRPSYRERRKNRMSSSRSSGEEGHGQLSSDSSLATGSKQSYESQGAIPKDRAPYREPSGLQTGESSLCSSSEQSLGPLSLDSSIATDTTQSYELQGAEANVQVQNTGSSDLPTGVASLCSSGEQSLGQLSLDSSGKKRGVEKYLTASDKLLESTLLANYTRSVLDLDKNVSNLVLGDQQGIEQLSLDSLATEQSSEKKSDISAADDVTSQNNPDEVRQEPTQEHSGSSSEEETEIEIQEE